MTTADRPGTFPQRLVLATDLSPRCDRALDRAVQLARGWRAELLVLTVLEAPARPDSLGVATWPPDDAATRERLVLRQLRRDIAGLDVPAVARVVRGETADTIRLVAEQTGAGLIVTGVARNEFFGRLLLGSTVERLVRTTREPLLVVRSRVHGPYRRIVVATDFSDASLHALRLVASLFPQADLTLYHAFTARFHGTADEGAAAMRETIEREECAAFLERAALPAEARARLRVVVEYGVIETALARHVRDHEADLVAVATVGRSGIAGVLLGNTAARLIDWVPCDTLIVRPPGA